MIEAHKDLLWFPPQLWIRGQWCQAQSGRTFPVEDPGTGKILVEVPLAEQEEATAAVLAAATAWDTWRWYTPEKRAGYLLRIVDLLLQYREPLARLLVAEKGAPFDQCLGEVHYAAAFFRWFAEEARRVYGRTVSHPDPSRRLRVEYYPVGVVGAITPWNGPLGAPAKKVAAALAAGCTVVLKPAELTPLSAFALAHLTHEAELPPGVFNVVCGNPEAIGRVLLDHDAVRLIAMTGSTRTGRYLMSEAGKKIKRVALELGGNAPFLVFADADLDRAADDLVWLKLLSSGQVCVTANRLLVARSVAGPFVERLVERFRRQCVGPGSDPQTTVGPLIDRRAVDRITALVQDAVADGARICYQGQVPPVEQGGYYFPPTLLDDVTPKMRIANEEIFGPVLPILRFDTDDEALRQANDTPYGLAAYAYTQNMARAQQLAEALEAGVVGINDPRPIIPEAPFGGIKQSGIGREGGTEGLLEYLEPRLIGFRYSFPDNLSS